MRLFLVPIMVFSFCAVSLPLSGEEPAQIVDVSAAENVKPALPNIPNRTFNLVDYGAVADGKTLNTEAFTKAIAAVEESRRGKTRRAEGRLHHRAVL